MKRGPSLPEKVSQQLDAWIEEKPLGCRLIWVKKPPVGEIFIRYNAKLDRIDLSSFSIAPDFQKKGIALRTIELAVKKAVKTVRVENILVPEWAEKVKGYLFKGRDTIVQTFDPSVAVISVDFIRNGH